MVNKNNTLFRILAVIFLFISVLFFPIWMTIPLGIIFLFVFNNFYEFIILSLFNDLLYGVEEPRFFTIKFVTFLISLILFFVVKILKKKIKFYR